jgi:hypothetical protein
MIWLCGIVDIDIFCAPNRNFLCTIPALTTSFRKPCRPRLPWRNFTFRQKKNTILWYVVSYFFKKIPIGKFVTILDLGSMLYNFAAVQKNIARFDVRKAEF